METETFITLFFLCAITICNSHPSSSLSGHRAHSLLSFTFLQLQFFISVLGSKGYNTIRKRFLALLYYNYFSWVYLTVNSMSKTININTKFFPSFSFLLLCSQIFFESIGWYIQRNKQSKVMEMEDWMRLRHLIMNYRSEVWYYYVTKGNYRNDWGIIANYDWGLRYLEIIGHDKKVITKYRNESCDQ